MMKAGYPPIDIKFTDRITYYNAFDAYHVKHDLSAMKNLLAGYVNTRLDKLSDVFQLALIEFFQIVDQQWGGSLRMKDFCSKNEKISNDGNGRCYLNP